MIVKKKILPKYFDAVRNGSKTFELRQDVDNIQVGDELVLQEYSPNYEEYTGNELTGLRVTYVLRNAMLYGLAHGYCIIGFDNKEMLCSYDPNLDDFHKHETIPLEEFIDADDIYIYIQNFKPNDEEICGKVLYQGLSGGCPNELKKLPIRSTYTLLSKPSEIHIVVGKGCLLKAE